MVLGYCIIIVPLCSIELYILDFGFVSSSAVNSPTTFSFAAPPPPPPQANTKKLRFTNLC